MITMSESSAAKETASRTDAPSRILVVDDEPALLRLMEFVLARQGYVLRMATNGDEALIAAQEFRPDLIVLDIMMPRRDGYAVTEAIRADPTLSSTPILMLSAKAQEADIERGMAVGVDTYITKPFDPDALAETVASYLRRSKNIDR